MAQTGRLVLEGVTFLLDDCNETEFYIFGSEEQEGTITICFDLSFQRERFRDDVIAPFIGINSHETGKTTVQALAGTTYGLADLRQANDREDMFYVYEHEPIEKYSFTIVEVLDEQIHLQMEGIAIIDGYADPYQTAEFSADVWLDYE